MTTPDPTTRRLAAVLKILCDPAFSDFAARRVAVALVGELVRIRAAIIEREANEKGANDGD